MKNFCLILLIALFGLNQHLAAFNPKLSNDNLTLAHVDSSEVKGKNKFTDNQKITYHKTNRFTAHLSKNIYAAGFKANKATMQEDFLYFGNNLQIKTVYPNPANQEAFLDYNMLENIRAKVTIRNLLGKVITEYDLHKNEKQIKIPTVQFDPGIYFYSLSINGKSVKAKKLIVDHR
jgi:hypothetical protein